MLLLKHPTWDVATNGYFAEVSPLAKDDFILCSGRGYTTEVALIRWADR
jgi:hypothetical protein